MKEIENYIYNTDNGVKAFLAIKNGEEIMHYEQQPGKRLPVYSITKSVLSMGLSFLVKEGRFDINRPLAKYLTNEQLKLVPDDKTDAFGALAVKRFLTMSLKGYPFRPEGESGWIKQALSADIDYTQPPQFSYSNFPAMLVGVAGENAADMPMYEYICTKLLKPLGIENPPYKKTPEGYFYSASGIEMTVSELSALGVYLLENAHSDSYLAEAASEQISTGGKGYGYFFYVKDGCFYMSGKWGQKCIVSKDKKTVVAYMCDRPQGDDELFDKVLSCLC